MDPNAPHYTPPPDDEEPTTLNKPEDTDDGLPPTDGDPLEDDKVDEEDVDEIQEPLKEDDDDKPDEAQDSEEIQTALSESDDLENNTSIIDNSDEANAYEDEDKPSPLP